LLGVNRDKVLRWIRSGELKAANVSDATRPRYRVAREDLQRFLEARSAAPSRTLPKRRRRRPAAVTEFF
jgi:excisionase family DNA binding protein